MEASLQSRIVEKTNVCRVCFKLTSHKKAPTLTVRSERTCAVDKKSSKVMCLRCRAEFIGIDVVKQDEKWVHVRPRPDPVRGNFSKGICKHVYRGTCRSGEKCRYAHNQAEVWLWSRQQSPVSSNTHARADERKASPSGVSGTAMPKCEERRVRSYSEALQQTVRNNPGDVQSNPIGTSAREAKKEKRSPNDVRGVSPTQGMGTPKIPSSHPQPENELTSESVLAHEAVESGQTSTFTQAINGTTSPLVRNRHSPPEKQRNEEIFDHPVHHRLTSGIDRGRVRSMSQASSTYSQFEVGADTVITYRPPPQISYHFSYRFCRDFKMYGRCQDACRFAHSDDELTAWEKARSRECPVVNRNDRYSLCGYIDAGRRCPCGENCAFPHSTVELEQWNLQLATINTEVQNKLKARVISEYQKEGIEVFKARPEGVHIQEVSGCDLSLTWKSLDPVRWTFQISAAVHRPNVTLCSVVFLDALTTDFTIEEVLRVSEQRHREKIKIHGEGILNYEILPPCKVEVKISLKPRAGMLNQIVVFDFGTFFVARGLMVHAVLKKEDVDMLQRIGTTKPKRQGMDDWEQKYTIKTIPIGPDEEVDLRLPKYDVPKNVRKKCIQYKGHQDLTVDIYKERMHDLVYLEEFHQRKDISRYDLFEVTFEPTKHYQVPGGQGGVLFAPPSYYFIELMIDEVLYEGSRSIRKGTRAYLLPRNHEVVYQCLVEYVSQLSVILLISEEAHYASKMSKYCCSIQFVQPRVWMQSLHYAVEHVHLPTILPSTVPCVNTIPHSSFHLECLKELKSLKVNTCQQQAITSILKPEYQQIPTLVLGPFGCGKTYTLTECIKLLVKHVPDVHILVCTHSNSAADIYVKALSNYMYCNYKRDTKSFLLRIYYTGKKPNTVPRDVKKFCRMNGTQGFVIPPKEEVIPFSIVVTTLSTSRVLQLMKVPRGHFTYIFIDEAAQVLEPESLIPLSLADSTTKIVLAGDHMQMEPTVCSKLARECKLHVSLLERLCEHETYDTEAGQKCKSMLVENYRSRQEILDLPSELFYESKLKCKAKFDKQPSIPTMQFVGVDGQECKDMDSPSFYNFHEAMEVANIVSMLVSKGLKAGEICVVSYHDKQVQYIRNILRNYSLDWVEVHRLENVQGREFRALLISTVRTCSDEPTSENEEGFHSNPKLFNTAISRARECLIVVGDPITLCTLGYNQSCWRKYIKKCLKLDSFVYPFADKFVDFVQSKLLTRQILENLYKKFLEQSVSGQMFSAGELPESDSSPSLPPLSSVTSGDTAGRSPSSQKPVRRDTIGSGAYGTVVEIELEGKIYAAKTFKEEFFADPNKRKKFDTEFKILGSLHHKHIVQYHRVCFFFGDANPALVMERLDTNLHDYLNRTKLTLWDKTCIVCDVAEGLAYLHSRTPPIIHRDLTANNILLDKERTAKIADFGNAKFVSINSSSSAQPMTYRPGTPAYMAPEAMTNNPKYDTKLDIFSFGILMLFTFTQSFPHDVLPATFKDPNSGKLCALSEVDRRKKYFDMLYEDLGRNHPVVKLILSCLDIEPGDRPSANDARDNLKQIKSNHTDTPTFSSVENPQYLEDTDNTSPIDIN